MESSEHSSVCQRCINDTAALRAAVFGNGEPEKSLLVRMDRVERKLGMIHRLSLATLCGVGTLLVRLLSVWVDHLF